MPVPPKGPSLQALHLEDAKCSDDHSAQTSKYTVVNWEQVVKIQLEQADTHWGPEAVKITLFMTDGTIIDPGRVIRGFPIPVVAKELKTFVYVQNRVEGHADFSEFEAYLQEQHG